MPETSNPAQKTSEDDAWLNEISQKTLIKVLLKNGIVTARELVDEEKHNRTTLEKSQFRSTHHHNSRIKRFASHYRWSRRLTHFLFGWEWKRVKASPGETDSTTHPHK